MGTSQSGIGPNGRSPLIPSWAADVNSSPQTPAPDTSRFKAFRQEIGAFVKENNSSKLNSALGYYARTATHGGSTAVQRLSSTVSVGAQLVGLVSGHPQTGTNGATLQINDFTGRSCEEVIAEIADFLTPLNGDGEKIRNALNDALSEALEGQDVFDPSSISNDLVLDMLICYLTESVFLQIVSDAGKSWLKAESATRESEAENELRELIKVVVDQNISQVVSSDLRSMTNQQVESIEKSSLNGVWTEWETYR
jgi:hypothetical protein